MTALHEATGSRAGWDPIADAPATRSMAVAAVPRQRTTGSHRQVRLSGNVARVVPAPRSAPDDDLPTAEHLAAPSPRRVRRRPSVLLAALVAGGVVAGALGIHDFGEPAAATSVLAAQDALLGDDQLEAMPMAMITEAEAQARLEEVAASRQERADAKAAAEAARLAAIEAARPKTVLPVDGARLTSGFGARWGTFHYGIDLAAPMHTPEYAAADGVVLRAGSASGFGLAVYVLHESGDVTVYGHMDEILVSPGDYVEAGDTIALLGNTGQSTGPHLHFEVHQGGQGGTKIDPIGWLRDRGVDI
jgi:murein DD-endopeptidase MepM/ murein hydrolase activator NlpD